LRIREEKDHVRATMEYNGNLFEASTIQRLLQSFQTLLTGISVDPDQKISALPLLSEAERRQLLGDWDERPAATMPQDDMKDLALQKLRSTKRKRLTNLSSGRG